MIQGQGWGETIHVRAPILSSYPTTDLGRDAAS